MQEPEDTLPLAARKLDHLFKTVTKPDGSEYSYREVEASIKDMAQADPSLTTLTAGYIWKIRSGHIQSPGVNALKSLGRFFGVDLEYFDEQTPDEVPKVVILARSLSRDEQASEIALKATALSDDEKEMVLTMMEAILKYKQKQKGS